jgi:hypothetical protein
MRPSSHPTATDAPNGILSHARALNRVGTRVNA